MEAKTKYDIKDNIWLVDDNKAKRMFITGLVEHCCCYDQSIL